MKNYSYNEYLNQTLFSRKYREIITLQQWYEDLLILDTESPKKQPVVDKEYEHLFI